MSPSFGSVGDSDESGRSFGRTWAFIEVVDMRLAELFAGLVNRREDAPTEDLGARAPVRCPDCHETVEETDTYRLYRVCARCSHHFPMSAPDRIALVIDPGTFKELHRGLRTLDPLRFRDSRGYQDRLAEARAKTGLDDAIITGVGRIGGRPVAIGAMEFAFLGGSMGSVVGEKVARLFEHATHHKMAVALITASGGARMQEGMIALMQMAKTAAAAKRHHTAGLPCVAVLANPTMGGVTASFASLADVMVAEPGALIGFAGPRVIEQT
ncbi:MAG: hypothetical protein NZ518_04765, partial [Dehalococcoidia bacterium]|nr:hypothetical protein [Dehalococcoidia bacterium]